MGTGTIDSGQTEVRHALSLGTGTHQLECQIIGAENPESVGYITPKCRSEIIPEIPPTGDCQLGDNLQNAVLCPGDDVGIGADVPVKVVDVCTASRKCEYQCNTGFGSLNGRCQQMGTPGTVTVPGSLRPNLDYPLVQCQAGDSGHRFFKYKIVKKDDTVTPPPVCPVGASGTYPACVCPNGSVYNLGSNVCDTSTQCPA